MNDSNQQSALTATRSSTSPTGKTKLALLMPKPKSSGNADAEKLPQKANNVHLFPGSQAQEQNYTWGMTPQAADLVNVDSGKSGTSGALFVPPPLPPKRISANKPTNAASRRFGLESTSSSMSDGERRSLRQDLHNRFKMRVQQKEQLAELQLEAHAVTNSNNAQLAESMLRDNIKKRLKLRLGADVGVSSTSTNKDKDWRPYGPPRKKDGASANKKAASSQGQTRPKQQETRMQPAVQPSIQTATPQLETAYGIPYGYQVIYPYGAIAQWPAQFPVHIPVASLPIQMYTGMIGTPEENSEAQSTVGRDGGGLSPLFAVAMPSTIAGTSTFATGSMGLSPSTEQHHDVDMSETSPDADAVGTTATPGTSEDPLRVETTRQVTTGGLMSPPLFTPTAFFQQYSFPETPRGNVGQPHSAVPWAVGTTSDGNSESPTKYFTFFS
ncbi:hypothetical protein HK102_013279 [Quaeritorhiza haematococci]|nr:hypothetical protein HK102_013279 [Quaeritorhiza haematococci]